MKKTITLFMTLALAVALNAQLRPELNTGAENAKCPPSQIELMASEAAGKAQPESMTERGGGFSFCETFSNGLNGDSGYGAWTIQDSGNNTIWMMANSTSPNGEFAGTIAALASPTADNGWVIFDCDFYNTPVSDGYEDVTGWLTSPTLNLSSLNSVIVEYYQYFRYCCFPMSPLTLEVSNDNGSTWTVFPAHGSFYPAANTLSANPLNTKVDISCAAAGQSNVRIRFGYNSSGAAGYSHYFWGLDDICIYENTVANDLEVVQVTNGDIFNVWEYRVTPFEQRILAGDGGLVAGVIYRNNGSANQTNCVITVDILNSSQTVIHTSTYGPFDMPSFANTPECPSFVLDTLFLQTGWEPTANGTYYVRGSIASDQSDEISENNNKLRQFLYTTDEYGHDNENNLDGEFRPRVNNGISDPHGYGNFFHVPNAGSMAYGITVRFGPNSDNNTEFLAALAQAVDGLDNGDIIASHYYTFYTAWGDGNPRYFPFDDATSLMTGEAYCALTLVEDETPNEHTVLAELNSDSDNSTVVYQQGGSGDFFWFSAQTATPAIRLIFSNRVGVEEQTLAGLNDLKISPNPAHSFANVTFSLDRPRMVAYEVRDINGKLVVYDSGMKMQQGSNRIELNTSAMAAGSYMVSLVIDGQHFISRKLEVVK